jgi:hypothetical protein
MEAKCEVQAGREQFSIIDRARHGFPFELFCQKKRARRSAVYCVRQHAYQSYPYAPQYSFPAAFFCFSLSSFPS